MTLPSDPHPSRRIDLDDLATRRRDHALHIQLAATHALLTAPTCVCGSIHEPRERLPCLRAVANGATP